MAGGREQTDHQFAVIMAGGKGERFWPLSTSRHPKQVLSIVGDKPLLALAVEYLEGLVPSERVFVITSADLVDVTCEAVPALPRENVIGEPCGRDTAAVVALASALVRARDPEGVFAVLTADHVIRDLEVFRGVLREGLALAAARDVLVTIGIEPTFASTGFGYIEAAEALPTGGQAEFRRAVRFVEKPDRATAAAYVAAGNYFWNAGMFMWSAAALQRALGAHVPGLLAMAQRLEAHVDRPTFGRELEKEYAGLTKISVDYALMEKADNIVMARGVFRWDDVGSWEALANHFEADADGNVRVGLSETLDAGGNVVFSRDRLTALIGVKDLVVVQAEGATLVCHRSRVQDVKRLVTQLRARGACDALL